MLGKEPPFSAVWKLEADNKSVEKATLLVPSVRCMHVMNTLLAYPPFRPYACSVYSAWSIEAHCLAYEKHYNMFKSQGHLQLLPYW